MSKDYFPAKLAVGDRFCNRLKERTELSRNIELGRHVVLISPRRYGKSSLVSQVINELKIPFASIDLFLAYDDQAVTKRILSGVSQALTKLMTVDQKALSKIQKYFTNFKVGLNIGGFSIESAFNNEKTDAVEQILDSLQALVKLATAQKQKVIIFIDEFQDIASSSSSKAIQGAIRHVAQETDKVVFIFSGSNRKMLLELFDDKSKPLYMLCDKMLLDRMSAIDYQPYIQKAALSKWRTKLDNLTLDRILLLTELHPFYVNLLCNELWKSDNKPTIENVVNAWNNCYETEKRRLVAEIEALTTNQQKLLQALAVNPTTEPTSNQFLQLVGLSTSSVKTGLKSLIDKDMVYQIKKVDLMLSGVMENQYRVLDPLVGFALRKYN